MLEPVDILAALKGLTEHWSPKVVGRVNDQDVKVAKLLGEIVLHQHDEDDELLQVIRGRLRIQFEGGAQAELQEGQFCVVPRGMPHNLVADEECWVVLIETVSAKHPKAMKTPSSHSIAEQVDVLA